MARQGRILEIKTRRGSTKTTGILRPIKLNGGAAGADIYYTAPASLHLSINDMVQFKLGRKLKPQDIESKREVVVTRIKKNR
ncbi:MAG: hypothetical protein KAT43_05510 [Nanoarchaeota archaeon]|nr:hypothetical protein [Nanoarchaeota archaeon]